LIGILVAFSPVAWAQVDTDTTWEDDLDALEHEMLRDLLVPTPIAGGIYEAVRQDDLSIGVHTRVDVPQARAHVPVGLVGERPEGPTSVVDELAEDEVYDAVVLESPEYFDLTGIEPIFGLETLDHPQIHTYLHFWTTRGRRHLGNALARAGRYRALIDAELQAQGQPRELLYLVLIESGFNPRATSRAAAVGLWQFMARTARGRGLRVERRYDERRDPVHATRAGIEYLGSLYDRFGSWPLAMAAYNAGGGHVRGELRRYNVNDFWTMDAYSCVYDDARGYVYKIIAAAIIGEHPERFGFEGVVPEPAIEWQTVEVPGNTRLSVFARAAGVSVDELESLNPALLAPTTPSGDSYDLHLPAGTLERFIREYDDVVPGEEGVGYVHTVRLGDTLEHLSEVYGLPERVLRSTNGLARRESLVVGDQLVIPVAEDAGERALAAWEPVADEPPIVITPRIVFEYPEQERVFYQVLSSDDAFAIADAFGVTVHDLALWNDIDPAAELHSGMTMQLFVDPDADLSHVRYLVDDQVRAFALDSVEYTDWDEAESRRRRATRRTHTVRRGETVGRIARRYGVSTADIVRWNNLRSANSIRTGQQLRVR